MAQESIIETITSVIREALKDTNPSLPLLESPGNVDTALTTLEQAAQNVADSPDLLSWINRAGDWQTALENLASEAIPGAEQLDGLLVRVLQSQMPRTAALLTMLEIVVFDPTDGTYDIDWQKLRDFLSDPETAINEDMWEALLGDLGLPGSGYLPAVAAALLIMAPRTLLALIHGDLKFAALPALTTRSGGVWGDFRAASADWISLTIPFGDPVATEPNPASIFDWKSGLDPDLSATLAIRSDRVDLGGGNRRTDMEFWLAMALDGNEWHWNVGKDWVLRVSPGLTFGFGYVDGQWRAAFRQFVTDPAVLPGQADPVTVTFSREDPEGRPDILLGPPYDTRLEIRDLLLYLKVQEASPVFEIGLIVDGLALVLTNRWFRTFGITDEIFREGLRFDLDMILGYREGEGLLFNLASAFDVLFVLNWQPGGGFFTLHSIRLTIPFDANTDRFRVRGELRVHASAQIGPVLVVIDGVGAWGGYWVEPLDDAAAEREFFGFLPPTGIGLQIEAGPVTGGGFLERKEIPLSLIEQLEGAEQRESYGGALYVKVYDFSVTAFGIYERLPEGRPSFVMVLGVRFPGIQLGYGFLLTGIGGLVGIHRRIDTDALRERLTSGAAASVLFPDDPIKNAPTILGDLRALFPAAEGVYIAGITFQITWIYFARFDVGLAIELPGPSKIILLGVVRAEIAGSSPNKPLLQLRLDIVGILDFEKRMIEFDATLINSKALELFHLTGDAAFRLSYGDTPYTLLSIGGFHPDFNPEPAIVPELTRVALTQTPGFFGSGLFLRFEAYIAVTSNSFQIGAKVEAGLKAGPLNAIGFLAFDALIQFTPFYFSIRFTAGFRVRWNALTLAGVRIEGTLSGPGPIVVSGKFCIEILFFDICWKGSFEIGSDSGDTVAPVGSLLQELSSELDDPGNLEVLGERDNYVAYANPDATLSELMVSPAGRLVWRQKLAPLDLLLDRVKGVPLASSQAVVVESPQALDVADDWFSAGMYLDLSQSEALNKKAFEKMQAGVELDTGIEASASVDHPVEVQTFRLPFVSPPSLIAVDFFPVAVLNGLEGRTAAATPAIGEALVAVQNEQWTVRAQDGTVLADGLTETDAHQRARAAEAVALPADDLVDLGDV